MKVEEKIEEQNNEYVDGEELSGLFIRIPAGYKIVAQGLTGELREKEPGLRCFRPFDKKFIYAVNNVSIDFKKENYKSQEGFEIIIDTAVTFHKADVIKFHSQRNGIDQLKLLISEIIRTYVSQHTFEQVSSWTVNTNTMFTKYPTIDYDDPSISEEEKKTANNNEIFNNELIQKLSNFRAVYGISIDSIIVQKAELTAELKRSKEDDELTRARNKRMIGIAAAELEAAKKRAEASKAQGEAEAKVLEKKLKAISDLVGDAPSAEKLKLLRDYLIGNRASYTVIENGTGDDFYTKANVVANALGSAAESKGKSKVKKNNIVQGNK